MGLLHFEYFCLFVLKIGRARLFDGLLGRLLYHRLHRAVTLELGALFDDQGLGVDLRLDASRPVKLDAFPSADLPLHVTTDEDLIDVDLRVDFRGLADNQALARAHGALELSVDTKCFLEIHFARQIGVSIEKAGEIPR